MVDKLESIAEVEASFDRARAYLRSEGWPDDHGAIGYMAVTALLAGYERRSATPANGEQVERDEATADAIRRLQFKADFQRGYGADWFSLDRAGADLVLATLSTPTENARERVKVLEEALEKIAQRGAYRSSFQCQLIARTALGNKETDRHG